MRGCIARAGQHGIGRERPKLARRLLRWAFEYRCDYQMNSRRRDIVINDEELKLFHDWLQAKGEHPSVALTLRWISEFELYAE